MSTTLVTVLALAVGLPCTLLALAIVYHARVAARMPAADDGWEEVGDEYTTLADFSAYRPAAAAAASDPAPGAEPGTALAELRETIADLQQQLAGQRTALAGLLSERERAAEAARVAVPSPPTGADGAPGDLRGSVRRLAAEGLSERAIARRLHVALEEVRLASRRERAS